MNITFEPEFQGYSNSRLSLSRKVDIWSSLNISSQNIRDWLTLSAISSALDRISFCPDAMVAGTGRQLCSSDVFLTDGCLGWHRKENCADQLWVGFGQSFLWSAGLFVAWLFTMLFEN